MTIVELADAYAQASVNLECEILAGGTVSNQLIPQVDEARAALVAEVERMEAEIAALREDAERLDYLDSLAIYESRGFIGGTHRLVFEHDFDSPNSSFRAAINAARGKQ